jgi:hypothetical protein
MTSQLVRPEVQGVLQEEPIKASHACTESSPGKETQL